MSAPSFVARETVSSTYYLYGCEAYEFNMPIMAQVMFLAEREDKVEKVIEGILAHGFHDSDSDRLRQCLSARSWIAKMYAQLGVSRMERHKHKFRMMMLKFEYSGWAMPVYTTVGSFIGAGVIYWWLG